MSPKMRAYTTRKMPDDILKRMRILAAMKSAEEERRVTLEWVMTEVLRRGLPLLEREVLGPTTRR